MFITERMWMVFTVVQGKFEDRKKDERGVEAIEYALMAAGLAIIIGFALVIFKDKLYAMFNGIEVNTTDLGPGD